nr:hypothetical protein Iba_scaffold1573890CG0010 [Ipomoea batatas]
MPTTLPIRVSSAAFALKLSHFRSFSNLGISFLKYAASGSGAASIAADKQSAAPIWELISCSVNSASRNGLMMEGNGGLVRWEEMEAQAAMQAERTEELGSRRRRTTAVRSLER